MSNKPIKPTRWLSTLELETHLATDLSTDVSSNGLIFLTFGTAYREIDTESKDNVVVKPVARIAIGVDALDSIVKALTWARAELTALQAQVGIAASEETDAAHE